MPGVFSSQIARQMDDNLETTSSPPGDGPVPAHSMAVSERMKHSPLSMAKRANCRSIVPTSLSL